MGAPGLSRDNTASSAATLAGSAKSVLVSNSRSAIATCFTASACSSSCRRAFSASTVVITASSRR